MMKKNNPQPLLIRFLLVFLITCFSINHTYGQRLNYDQIIEELDKLAHQQAYRRLTNFQSQDPFFANTYLQLAHVSEQVFKNMDPLKEINELEYWVSNALRFYPMFSVYLESGEVRRNREYYENIPISYSGRRLETEDVLAYIDKRMEYCQNYLENALKVYAALEQSKDHYNNCVRIFNEINDTYDNLNEVFLQTDDYFLQHLDNLETEFNATVEEFEKYKTLIRTFPIKGYNQQYTLRSIKTFRLDGLTNSDFLQQQFYLWDYGSWIRQFRKTYDDDILTLRNDIEQLQLRFEQNKSFLLSIDHTAEDFNLETHGPFFFYRLGKYDNNSLIRELFTYMDIRQEFLKMSRNQLSSPADSSALLMNRKLRYYHRLALQQSQTGFMLDEFNESIETRRVVRFNQFFDKYYDGEDGLRSFYLKEIGFINEVFDERLGYLKQYFDNELSVRNALGFAQGPGNIIIPLTPVDINSQQAQELDYVTLDVHYEQGVPLYAAGFKKQRGAPNVPFVAKISEELTVKWVRELPKTISSQSKEGGRVEIIYPFGEGVMALTSSGYQTEVFVADEFGIDYDRTIAQWVFHNNLVQLDITGAIVFQETLVERNMPVFLHYDDINQISMLAFGREIANNPGLFSSITIAQVDSIGNVSWSAPIDLKGQLVDMVRTEHNYLAIFNFHEYNIAGESRMSGNRGHNTALLLAEISPQGSIANTTAVIGQESLYIDRLFSISSDEINLMGYSGLPGNRTGPLKYLIVSANSDILFHNLR